MVYSHFKFLVREKRAISEQQREKTGCTFNSGNPAFASKNFHITISIVNVRFGSYAPKSQFNLFAIRVYVDYSSALGLWHDFSLDCSIFGSRLDGTG